MSDVIQRYPFGLPDFFGLKAGQTPASIANTIGCSVEVAQLFLLNGREQLTQTIAVAALGFNNEYTNLQVPPGEVWYVWAFHNFCPVPAASSARIRNGVKLASPGAAPFGPSTAGIALEQIWTDAVRDIWVAPGGSFFCFVEALVGAAVPLTGQLTFTRIRV